MAKRVFLSDKAFTQLMTFIAERYFTYVVDTEIEPNRDVYHVTEALEYKYKKRVSKLRKSFAETGADLDEFLSFFFDGEYETDYRHEKIRKVLKRYYPESLRGHISD